MSNSPTGMAAAHTPKIFPMMTTPAGTIAPARVFVIGAGVAGLQAIATAKRLGARVEAFDTRPVVALRLGPGRRDRRWQRVDPERKVVNAP